MWRRNILLVALVCVIFLATTLTAQKSIGDGWIEYDSPELIPEYFAWKRFFWVADLNYRLGQGYYQHFIDRQLIVGRFLDHDSLLRKEMISIISLYASDAQRAVERSGNESMSSHRLMNRGIRTRAEHKAVEISLLKREIEAVRSSRDSLKVALVKLDAQVAAQVWVRILDFVQECKEAINIRRERTPNDDAMWEVILSFEESREEK